ncbi:MAG: hypothetical protein ACUVS7_00425 [Bryobacteraceae bacterium]
MAFLILENAMQVIDVVLVPFRFRPFFTDLLVCVRSDTERLAFTPPDRILARHFGRFRAHFPRACTRVAQAVIT